MIAQFLIKNHNCTERSIINGLTLCTPKNLSLKILNTFVRYMYILSKWTKQEIEQNYFISIFHMLIHSAKLNIKHETLQFCCIESSGDWEALFQRKGLKEGIIVFSSMYTTNAIWTIDSTSMFPEQKHWIED